MTDSERALWIAAKNDYTHALKIALEAWAKADVDIPTDTIQAAAATILIHVTKLRGEERLHVRVPPSAAPAETKAAAQSAAVPPCRKCGGAMEWVTEKRSEKAPDFVCLQQKGDCGTPSKDKKKWFPTGSWIDKLPPRNGANSKPVPAGSFDDMPEALIDSDDDPPF
jgi:hypothetical protein